MRRFRALAVAAVALVVVLGSACKSNGQRSGSTSAQAAAASATIDTGGRKLTFRVELALTPQEQERGLMYRKSLDADAGMLFVSQTERPHVFWMKNTLIPLDMIFIGANRRIVGIVQNAEPQTLTGRQVDGPSQYVLEIGGGLSASLGIRPGQLVEFAGVPTPTPP
jgi:uncharacterized membrane protein (UPF0127 family)